MIMKELLRIFIISTLSVVSLACSPTQEPPKDLRWSPLHPWTSWKAGSTATYREHRWQAGSSGDAEVVVQLKTVPADGRFTLAQTIRNVRLLGDGGPAVFFAGVTESDERQEWDSIKFLPEVKRETAWFEVGGRRLPCFRLQGQLKSRGNRLTNVVEHMSPDLLHPLSVVESDPASAAEIRRREVTSLEAGVKRVFNGVGIACARIEYRTTAQNRQGSITLIESPNVPGGIVFYEATEHVLGTLRTKNRLELVEFTGAHSP